MICFYTKSKFHFIIKVNGRILFVNTTNSRTNFDSRLFLTWVGLVNGTVNVKMIPFFQGILKKKSFKD